MTELLKAYGNLPMSGRFWLALVNVAGVIALGYLMFRGLGQMF